MEITKEWLKEKRACADGYAWFLNCGKSKDIDVLNALISGKYLQWANWLIVRVMNRKQKLRYAIFAAEQVIDIYEKKNPNNKAPRNAIKAAKRVLEHDTKENRAAAAAAADAADAAYAAAYAAADAAAYAAYAAAYAAYAAYADADADADAARKKNQKETSDICVEILGQLLIDSVNKKFQIVNK